MIKLSRLTSLGWQGESRTPYMQADFSPAIERQKMLRRVCWGAVGHLACLILHPLASHSTLWPLPSHPHLCCTCVYMYEHVRVCVDTCEYVWVCMCKCTCVYVYMCVCTCVCVRVCVCVVIHSCARVACHARRQFSTR